MSQRANSGTGDHLVDSTGQGNHFADGVDEHSIHSENKLAGGASAAKVEGPPAGVRSPTNIVVANPPRRVSKRTARERLQPYIEKATKRYQYQYRLRQVIKYGINFIIFLQILVGALVTIVSVVEPNQKTRIVTAVLGAVSTFTASVLARAKGTNQPQIAESHARELDKFIGDCQRYIDDMGDDSFGPDVDEKVEEFAQRFEDIEDKAVQADRGQELELPKVPTSQAAQSA